jgi:hypothetical protein
MALFNRDRTGVDRATANLYRSLEIEAIYKKWFEIACAA